MTRRGRHLLAAAAAIVSLSTAGRSGASPEYPDVIQSYLELPSARPCTLCHSAAGDAGDDAASDGSDGGGGIGPADRPFADSALARGMVQGDDGSLRSALDRMRADRVDSDGDTMADIDELAWGTDPNVPDRPQGDVPPALGYGCSAGAAPTSPDAAWIAAAVALSCFAARRRARRGRL